MRYTLVCFMIVWFLATALLKLTLGASTTSAVIVGFLPGMLTAFVADAYPKLRKLRQKNDKYLAFRLLIEDVEIFSFWEERQKMVDQHLRRLARDVSTVEAQIALLNTGGLQGFGVMEIDGCPLDQCSREVIERHSENLRAELQETKGVAIKKFDDAWERFNEVATILGIKLEWCYWKKYAPETEPDQAESSAA